MTTPGGCPSDDDLRAYLDGRPGPGAFAPVDDHVEGCPRCQAALARLTAAADAAWALPGLDDDALRAWVGGPGPRPHVPGYEIMEEAGRGGVGVVFRARDLTLDRPVALKVLRAGALAAPAERARFLAEARAVARLCHPNVVRVHAAGEAGGLPYLVMEWVEGATLKDRLTETLPDERESARLVAALARAVHAAHEAGVVHRDLKPANVLLPGPGLDDPKVTDFGLARLTSTGPGLTPEAAVLGTPEYMAPEVALAGTPAGPAADVYGLGAVLYECLTGRPPFRGPTPFETLAQVRDADPVPPRALQRAVPRDLETVCLRSLDKDPGRRYPSAEALADDLGRFLARIPVQARPLGRPARLVRWCRRHPAPAALAAALALVVAAALVATTLLWRRAEAKADEADRRRAAAREALLLYADAADKLFRDAAATTAGEREALARAAGQTLDQLAEGGGDPDLERRTARAALALANAMHNCGEFAPAERVARRAVAALARLTARADADREVRHDHAAGAGLHATLLFRLGRDGEAVLVQREALRAAEALVTEFPASDRARTALLSARWHFARELTRTGEFEEAEKLYEVALPDARALARRHPGDRARHEELRMAVEGYGRLTLARDGRPDRFLALYEGWLEDMDRVRGTRQDWAELVTPWFACADLAAVLARAGRPGESAAAFDRGAGYCRAAARPGDAEAAVRLGAYLFHAAAHFAAVDPARAATRLAEAEAVFEAAVAAAPGPLSHSALAGLLAHRPGGPGRDAGRAVELARSAVQSTPLDPQRHLTLATCLLAAGRDREALAEFEEWVPRAPTAAHARFQRVIARWRVGEQDAARAELRAVAAELSGEWFVHWMTWEAFDAASRLVEGRPADRAPPAPRRG